MRQLVIKVLNIIDARCNHEVYNDMILFFSLDLGHHKFLMQHDVSEAGSASVFRKRKTPNLADLFDTDQSLTVALRSPPD